MGDGVTKKDLQSLPGYCNQQIADLDKRVMAKIADVEKNDIGQINKIVETLNKNDAELLKGHESQQARINELIQTVNQHAQVIKQMQGRNSN